jgi:hypothetical protein
MGLDVRYQGTQITDPPMFRGPGGAAWRVELPAPGARQKRDWDGTLGIFLVHAPKAHPLWDHYALTMIHLRDIEGVKPPMIRVPGATHEFMIASLNPEQPLPSTRWHEGWHANWLTPIDVIEQFKASSDAVADRVLELAVEIIVDGRASPDQDWRPWWKQSIANTAAHYQAGTHDIGRSM